MNLFEKPRGVQTRWASFENPTAGRNCAALENRGAKGHPCDTLKIGETKTLLDAKGSGLITRIWVTVIDRSPEMLRGLRIDMFWDDAPTCGGLMSAGRFLRREPGAACRV